MMPATLEAGNIQGYCVGEPWNQQAVAKRIGVPVTTNYDIWKNKPEKVFGVTQAWAEAHPNTHLAVIKSLIRAGKWLDQVDSRGQFVYRQQACRILARPNYVGADYDVLRNSMTGHFVFQLTDRRVMPDFNVFFRYHATYPWYSDGIWYLTQMRRWGQISEPKTGPWYHETVRRVYRPDIYRTAAQMLIDEGHLSPDEVPSSPDGYRPPTEDFIDRLTYDGRNPVGYLNSHAIGIKDPLP
jgi:nitrate/nitrite transport system substrate-binding protein